MPDESCRTCGGMLASYSLCPECRMTTQQICNTCGKKTEERYHNSCLYVELLQTRSGTRMEMVSEHKNHIKTPKRTFLDRKHIGINSIKKNHSLRNILTFSAVALILGVVANGNYFGVFNNQNEDEKIITPLSDPLPIPDIIHTLYENCLGSGNVQYMIVKCPTDKGYVYETIFVTPYELATKFSKKFFSIRDISVNETFDGSILLQYQRSMYKTSYFEK